MPCSVRSYLGVLSYSSENRTVGNNGVVKAMRNVMEMQGIVCVDEGTARKLGTCKNRRYEANEPYCRDWVLSVVLSSH